MKSVTSIHYSQLNADTIKPAASSSFTMMDCTFELGAKINPSSPQVLLFGYFIMAIGNGNSDEALCVTLYSSTVYNSQTTQMSINWNRVRQNMIHLYGTTLGTRKIKSLIIRSGVPPTRTNIRNIVGSD